MATLSGIWTLVKTRNIGAHMLALSGRTNDGFEEYRVSVDCVVQFRGSLHDCERAWRRWVRLLNPIAKKRASKIESEVAK